MRQYTKKKKKKIYIKKLEITQLKLYQGQITCEKIGKNHQQNETNDNKTTNKIAMKMQD